MLPGVPDDDRGASQVVGVILLIGIVVVLGAVVATFALGLGQEVQNVGPSASLSFDYTDGDGASADCGATAGADSLVIEHASGDPLDSTRVTIKGSSVSGANVDLDASCTSLATEMTAGNAFSIAVQDDDVVRVVWEYGGNSAVVGKWEGPDS